MSVQETKLTAIAEAIREKEGSTEPILASDFPERIRAISTVPEGTYEINLSVSDPEGGTVKGGGLASEGMTITIGAEIAEGFLFDGWQEGGEVVSENKSITFQVTGDRNLIAAVHCPQYMLGRDWWSGTQPVYGIDRVTYGDGKFVAVANERKDSSGSNITTSHKAVYSTDGVTWTEAEDLPSTIRWQGVAYGGGKFVAVASYDYSAIAYSSDGITWTKAKGYVDGPWHLVAYGNGTFVAVASTTRTQDATNYAAYSTDGVTWVKTTFPDVSKYRLNLIFADGKFVVVTGSTTYFSTDGITWTASANSGAASTRMLAYGKGLYVQIMRKSQYGTGSVVLYSTDAITWERGQELTGTFNSDADLAYGGDTFVAMSPSGQVAYSQDGVTWSEVEIPIKSIESVAYGDGKFVGVGSSRAIYSSAAGPVE